MTTVLTYGVFDSLTPQNMTLLQQAKAQGNRLVVGLATDAFLAQNQLSAAFDYDTRREMLAQTVWVDEIIALKDWTQDEADATRFDADVLVVTSDWRGKLDNLQERVRVVTVEGKMAEDVASTANELSVVDSTQLIEIKRLLLNSMFRFKQLETAQVYTDALIFKADGTIAFGTEKSFNEAFWRFDEQQLILENEQHQATTIFDLTQANGRNDGLLVLTGDYVPSKGAIKHQLQEMTAIERDQSMLSAELAVMGLNKSTMTGLQTQVSTMALQTNPFSRKIVHTKPRIMFILNDIRKMVTLSGLMTKLNESSQVEVKVYVTDRFAGGQVVAVREDLEDLLRAMGLSVIQHAADDYADLDRVKAWNPDYIFRQTLDDSSYPEAFQLVALSWAKLAYVPNVITGSFMARDGVVTAEVQAALEKMWRVFVSLPLSYEEDEALRESLLGEENVVVAGSPKAIAIRDAQPTWPLADQRYKILWLAHKSVGQAGAQMGSFDKMAARMYKLAQANTLTSFVFSPHPDLRASLATGVAGSDMTVTDYDTWLADWVALPNTAVIENETVYNAMADASLVVTDGVAPLYEAQILQKPVIFFERDDHADFSNLGLTWIRGVHAVHTIKELAVQMNALLIAPDELKAVQAEDLKMVLDNQYPIEMIMATLLDDFLDT